VWLRLLWQLKELLPLLGKLLPLLEGWVAGNVGASSGNIGTQKALAQLEARVGSSQEGLDSIGSQLRDHGTVLLHLSNEVKQLRAQAEADRSSQEEMAHRVVGDLAALRKLATLLGVGVLLLLAGVFALLLVVLRRHAG
jgi:cell division protein FtsX